MEGTCHYRYGVQSAPVFAWLQVIYSFPEVDQSWQTKGEGNSEQMTVGGMKEYERMLRQKVRLQQYGRK
jgi:hypothetical protein